MKLCLREVTICAVDCAMPDLALRGIYKSLEACSFGDALLLSHDEINCENGVRFIGVEQISSIVDYSRFLMKDLHRYIETPYVLIIQWDGYVIDPLSWSPAFLEYDYVGAKWPWHQDKLTVGNGGFSLRSKKLLDAVASSKIPFITDLPEDDQICRVHRESLEKQFGIKFADEVTADLFSYERSLPDVSTFGFHGIFNMWRYLEDSEVEDFADRLTDATYNSVGFYELFMQYFLLRKFRPLNALYKRIYTRRSQREILKNIVNVTKDENFSALFLDLCNKSLLRG